MADIAGDEQHVTDLLGLYYMDALDRSQGDAVERHLQSCPRCRSAADETIETIAALELLPEDDRRELLANFGALHRTGPPPARFARFFGEPRVDEPDKGSPPGRSGPTAPPARRTFRMRNRRTAALLRNGVLLAVVLVVAGLAVGALLRTPAGSSAPSTTVAATAADDRTGASLSVSATQPEDGVVTIRATVNGLRAGRGYQLHAVTTDGRTVPVLTWTSDGKVQELSGDVQVPLAALSLFTVVLAGEGPVVSAYLTPTAGQPRAS
ncbi:zf-HC2 domain-containing protein [Actinoplanes sp. NPDC049681]|uniref:zf-HC2 domain-containing protein n=1 Tax=Actinoplanes sp. NPDC049681 TaxID=3363905 RepID=UPI0037AA0175